MKRAEKHLDSCEDKECKYSLNGTRCVYGLRKFGCVMEDPEKAEYIQAKKFVERLEKDKLL